ncbi:MAG: hypothetical protein ACTSRG_12990 [Candidatus Helarchaeota archaeon]
MQKSIYIWILLIASSVLLIPSCSSNDQNYESKLTNEIPILSYQRLGLRKDYGSLLTNRTGKVIVKHDLNNKITRKSLRASLFVCRVGKKAFHICKDRAGFCHKTLDCLEWKRRFLKKKICIKYKEDFLSIRDDLEFLLSVKIACMSRIIYPNFARKI